MKILADEQGVLLESEYDESDFARDALEAFPEFRELFDEDPTLLHIHMASLADIARQAIREERFDLAMRVVELVSIALEKPGVVREIANAVALSFVSAWELRKSVGGCRLLEEMPESVRAVLIEQELRDESRG